MADEIEYPVGKQQRAPTHPGALWHEILHEHVRMSVADAASRMGVSRQALHAVLREDSPVTIDMALRFGRLVGAAPELYVQMQFARDIWFAEQRLRDVLAAIAPAKAA